MHKDFYLHKESVDSPGQNQAFSIRFGLTVSFDNQKDRKQDYLLMHFSEKKRKTGLKKTIDPTRGGKWRRDAFFSRFPPSGKKSDSCPGANGLISVQVELDAPRWGIGSSSVIQFNLSSSFGNAARRDLPVAGQIAELVVEETAEHQRGEESRGKEPGLEVVSEER